MMTTSSLAMPFSEAEKKEVGEPYLFGCQHSTAYGHLGLHLQDLNINFEAVLKNLYNNTRLNFG